MNKIFHTVWNAALDTWVAVSEIATSHSKATSLLTGAMLIAAAPVAHAALPSWQELGTYYYDNGTYQTYLGGQGDKTWVPNATGTYGNFAAQIRGDNVFRENGGELNFAGGYYRNTGRIIVLDGVTAKITGGGGDVTPNILSDPAKSAANILLYNPNIKNPPYQLIIGDNATLEVALRGTSSTPWGKNYIMFTNNGNYSNNGSNYLLGTNAHVMVTSGGFRLDPYTHDRFNLSNIIFNGGYFSTRDGDDTVYADENGQAVGYVELGKGADQFIVLPGVSIVGHAKGNMVKMYETQTGDKWSAHLTGSQNDSSAHDNPDDLVELREGSTASGINFSFGQYNDTMILADGARLLGGTVDMFSGNDTFVAHADPSSGPGIDLTEGASIDMGAGNDILTLHGTTLHAVGAATAAAVRMGAGDDTIDLNKQTVLGTTGRTTIDLGAGNDTLNIADATLRDTTVNMASGNDTVNVRASAAAGQSVFDGQIAFLRGNTAADNQFHVTDAATLTLTHGSSLDFAGRIHVDEGGILRGEGSTSVVAESGTDIRGTVQMDNVGVGGTGTLTLAGGATNGGIVILAGPSTSIPGNTLIVRDGYAGDDGRIVIRTVMGDDDSRTDRLVLEGGDGTGQTGLVVKSAGGGGALTNQGIRVVETRDGATTADGAFHLDPASDGYRQGIGSLAVGAYDYLLARGGNGGIAEDWYLISRTEAGNTTPVDTHPAVPEDPLNPGAPQDTTLPTVSDTLPAAPAYRPEVGAYLGNRQAAATMPVHTLHERQGQAPGLRDPDSDHPGDSSAWARAMGATSHHDGANGLHGANTGYIVHAGSDVLRFADGKDGSIRLGVMGLYGSTSSRTDNGTIGARGTVDGYQGGIYGTWYGRPDILSGPYVDTWLLLGTQTNTVMGDGLPSESYRSHTFTGSLEGGYSFLIRDSGRTQVYVEPQAQVVLQRYRAGDHAEAGGTVVTSASDDWLTTRLGVRLHGNVMNDEGLPRYRPFAEFNWWHGPGSQTLQFNSDVVRDALPANRYEVKAGVQGNITRRTSVWGSAGVETGSGGYLGGKAAIGVKYNW